MGGYSDLLLFFAVYSFLGWMLETTFASINERKFINRGFLTGVFCPIYGFGAILIIQSSQWVNTIFTDYFTALIISMLFSIFLVTALEYITGLLLEKIFNCKWWDYSNNAANLQGYICIKYSLFWGLLAFFLVQIVHPAISEMIFSIPTSIKGYIATLLFIYFLADTAKSVIDALDLREVVLNYSKFPVSIYCEKILQYKRFFLAFPRLLILNAGIINRDVRSVLNDRLDKIKMELKSRFP
ncbi:MAG: putative ABC transporter permease [Thermincolia bacterium]